MAQTQLTTRQLVADVLTGTEHTAIADGAPHHAAVTLGDVAIQNVLDLAGQSLTLDSQTANYVLAGPASGAAADPAFRAIVPADMVGAKTFHGVQAIGAITFVDATHILSVATITYWYAGVKYTTAAPTACDIDTYEALADNTTYFFYFDAAAGTLKAKATVFNLMVDVPVATVFWNGTSGAIAYEAHGYNRSLDWHEWAHETIGARYQGGLALTNPSVGTPNQLSISGGNIHDEDIDYTITNPQTTCRIMYQASAGVYTWVNNTGVLPYAGTVDGTPQYLDTDTWALTDATISKYACMWVYATLDQVRPIHIVPTQASAPHNTLALARAETAPDLSALNISSEFKLIYRFIFKGNGDFQESNDYRLSSPLPSGGASATTAAAVSFSPSGTIIATTVQTALEELDGDIVAIGGVTLDDASGTAILTPVVGVALTAMRSDGAPALNPAVVFQREWFYV
jgi:hypothetical protein